jgi:hypothetical protein
MLSLSQVQNVIYGSYIMSDYQWTEKQIQKAYGSRRHKQGWLNARDIRSGFPAASVRQLMQIMCDRGYAFDNLTSVDSDQYKICFNLEKKEQMLKEIQDSKKDNFSIIFDTSLLSNPRLVDLPLKDFLKFATTSRMRFCWTELNIEWQEIYKEFFRCQNGGDMQDSQYIHANLLPVDASKQQIEDTKALILSKTNTFVKMYIALKIGWQEIKNIYPRYSTYNDLFLEILSAHYSVKIFRLFSFQKSKQTERTISSKLDVISKLPEFIMSALEHSCENANDSDKKYWKIILEDYIQDPHGRGLQNAFDVLLEFANEDEEENYVKDELNSFCKAFSKLSNFPRFKSYDDFCMYFETENQLSDDPFFNELFELSNAYPIKEALRASENLKVTDAVFEWANAEKEIIEVSRTIFRRKAQQPKLYNTGEIKVKATRRVSKR